MGSPTSQCISSQSVSLPTSDSSSSEGAEREPSGPADECVRYGLTAKGRAYLDARKPGASPSSEEGLDRRERRRRRARRARAAGHRFGTVCGRYRDAGRSRAGSRVPDLRLSGQWLRASGFDLGQEFEVEVGEGRLVIRAV